MNVPALLVFLGVYVAPVFLALLALDAARRTARRRGTRDGAL